MIVVEVLPSDVGTIVIAKSRDLGSIVYLQDGLCQSEADDEGVSYAPYIHAMFDLTIQAHAAKILLIGCGGGTLATMLTHAGLAVTVVDINPVSFDVARRHFCLDETITCHVDDGLSWLENSREKFDCIIVDAFLGEEMPDHLCSTLFFKEVKCHLSGDGVVLVNFLERTRELFYTQPLMQVMTEAGFGIRVLEEARLGFRNVIVLGGAVEKLLLPQVRMPPQEWADVLAFNLQSMRFRGSQPIVQR